MLATFRYIWGRESPLRESHRSCLHNRLKEVQPGSGRPCHELPLKEKRTDNEQSYRDPLCIPASRLQVYPHLLPKDAPALIADNQQRPSTQPAMQLSPLVAVGLV
jgi:hypothetical protein